jgi:hypothetical protein
MNAFKDMGEHDRVFLEALKAYMKILEETTMEVEWALDGRLHKLKAWHPCYSKPHNYGENDHKVVKLREAFERLDDRKTRLEIVLEELKKNTQ